MARFTNTTKQWLQDSRWYPGRSVATADIQRFLTELGYPTIPIIVREFFEEFTELQIRFEIPEHPNPWTLNFDIRNMARSLEGSSSEGQKSKTIPYPYWPIGEVFDYLLFMDSKGTVYGEWYPYLDIFGVSIEQAIENVMRNKFEKRLLPYNDDEIRRIFGEAHNIAILDDPETTQSPYSGYQTGSFFKAAGFNICFVNPEITQFRDFPCYSSLEKIPVPVDIVLLTLRHRLENIAEVVERASIAGAKLFWIERRNYGKRLHELAENAGVKLIMYRNRMRLEYERIFKPQ